MTGMLILEEVLRRRITSFTCNTNRRIPSRDTCANVLRFCRSCLPVLREYTHTPCRPRKCTSYRSRKSRGNSGYNA
jgi:hypothetical protein